MALTEKVRHVTLENWIDIRVQGQATPPARSAQLNSNPITNGLLVGATAQENR